MSYLDQRLLLPSAAMGEYVLMFFTDKMPFSPLSIHQHYIK